MSRPKSDPNAYERILVNGWQTGNLEEWEKKTKENPQWIPSESELIEWPGEF